jgi:prenyl protein peptidase
MACGIVAAPLASGCYFWYLTRNLHYIPADAATALGFVVPSPRDLAMTFLLVSAFFLGHICLLFSSIASRKQLFALRTKLILVKEVLVAPVCEELIFRSPLCLVEETVDSLARAATFQAVLFGVAHTIHFVARLGSVPLSRNLLMTIFQISYSCVFGLIAALFLRATGSIAIPILAHVLCNIFGFPPLNDIMRNPGARTAQTFGIVAWAFGLFYVVRAN